MKKEKISNYINYIDFPKDRPFDEEVFNRIFIPDKSKELVGKLRKISDNGDFLLLTPFHLETEEERRFVIKAIDNGELKNSSEVIFLMLLIDEARKKAKGKGDYLKDVKIANFDENCAKNKDITIRELFEKADAGDVNAMLNVVYSIKADVIENEDAKNWFMQLRISYLHKLVKIPRHETAMVELGDAYAYGEGTPQDAQKAIRWYKKAIKAYCTFAYENIGLLYFEGIGVTVDYKKAFRYFTKEKPYNFSTLYSLGEMYRQGLYVEKDIKKACKYYEKIAYYYSYSDRFNPYYWRACYRLAMLIYEGRKTEKRLKIALQLLIEAKDLYGKCKRKRINNNDITKKEIEQSWLTVNDALVRKVKKT